MTALPCPAAVRERQAALEARFETDTIGRFFERRAHALGDAPAIEMIEGGQRASYRELDRYVNRVGRALLAVGVRKGARVAAMLPNRIDYPVLWLALAKLGAVHVPVNLRYTAAELTRLLADSGASLLVADAGVLAALAADDELADALRDLSVLTLGEPRGRWPDLAVLAAGASDASCLDDSVAPDDLMNVQYTSGTTGMPKGCLLTHEYWMVLSWAATAWDAEPVTRLLSAQPFFYMDPQWHLLKAARLGATLVIAPRLSATQFAGWVRDYRVAWCQYPLLAARQPFATPEPDTTLRQVATFGWDPETCRAFRRRHGAAVRAREGYGMTEIGLGTWMPADFDSLYDSGSIGIAGPFRETSVRDEAGTPVPEGATGELWVRGRAIFRGYWRRPEATAAVLDADGWFRTGDLVRADERGLHWLVGRKKDMIRRASENIAAAEVEAVVRALAWVEDVAAVAVPDPTRGEEVMVFVQCGAGAPPAARAARELVAASAHRLAAFKVPRYVAFVDAFPRTASNKIEKARLLSEHPGAPAGAYDRHADTQA